MTARQAYEYALIEINKIKAPSLLIEDYNYLFNKAIQQKVNELYNRFDTTQQSTDDLNILQTTEVLNVQLYTINTITKKVGFKLPDNYFHLLNCISTFEINNNNLKCYSTDSFKGLIRGCKKLTSDIYPQIINNSYMKPSDKNPYFFIISVKNEDSDLENKHDNIIEIHYNLNSPNNVKEVLITYLRIPKKVDLTQDQIDDEKDSSDKLEFPEYMCYEIINTFAKLLLDNASDPRLQTNIPINQSIASVGASTS